MIRLSEDNILIGEIPRSDAVINCQIRGGKDSCTCSYYAGDSDERKNGIKDFLANCEKMYIDIESIHTATKQLDEILKSYIHMFKGSILDYTKSKNFFLNKNTDIEIEKIHTTGNRDYYTFDNDNEVITAFKGLLFNQLTQFEIRGEGTNYYVSLVILDKWREKLMSTKLEKNDLISTFDSFMNDGIAQGKSPKKLGVIFGVKYSCIIAKSGVQVENLVEESQHNIEGMIKAVKFGMELSPDIIWETSPSVYNDITEPTFLEKNVYGIHIKEKNDALSKERPHICIGWSGMGDLSNVATKEELGDRYDAAWPNINPRKKGQDIGQIWAFINEAKIGDYVIFSDNDIFHIGVIESEYLYDDTEYENQDGDYTNTRNVTWLKTNLQKKMLSDVFRNSLSATRSFWKLSDYKLALAQILDGTYVKDEIGENAENNQSLNEIVENEFICDKNRNEIFFGAPGTGKSFSLEEAKDELIKNGGTYERVTFHPDYSYSNFVGTYKPTPKGENEITYEFVPGPFMRVLINAINNLKSSEPTKPHVLIIEEINRANVAAVFGDVFQLLDRNEKGVSEYSINATEDMKKYLSEELGMSKEDCCEIKIPSNMFIWATMNSADQGVFPMDTAFKRRWDFKYIGINDEEFDENGNEAQTLKFKAGGEELEWNILRRAINEKLSDDTIKLNEDKLMGPYFIKVMDNNKNPITEDKFIELFKNKVLMYLFEDAAKSKRKLLFNENLVNVNRYSDVCEKFSKYGLKVFGADFEEKYYKPQKDAIK